VEPFQILVPRLLDEDEATERPLTIHVIATSDEGTERALIEARKLSEGLRGRIVVLVPHQVSYAIPLTNPAEAPDVIGERYRMLGSAAGVDATVRLCFCRRTDDVFRSLLIEESVVVIGGRRQRWWPSRAERVARRLARAGHHVVFASSRRDCKRP
jgi:hypothetical protein